MTKRTDSHSPRNFDPVDYEVIDYIDLKQPEFFPGLPVALYAQAVEGWRAHIRQYFPNFHTDGDNKGLSTCSHCGTHIRWAAVVRHIPSGDTLTFGEICAERVDLPGRDAFRAKFIKDRAALEAARLENEARKAAFAEANPVVVEYLSNDDNVRGEFLISIAHQLETKGELSERQVEAVEKNIARQVEFEARKAAEAELLANALPLEDGRRVIEGEILSVKVQYGDYGEQVKMLVKQDDGNKVWGTVPSALESKLNIEWHGERGKVVGPNKIKLTATVERSRDDEHFGFYKRPTKAEVLA